MLMRDPFAELFVSIEDIPTSEYSCSHYLEMSGCPVPVVLVGWMARVSEYLYLLDCSDLYIPAVH